MSNSFSGKKLGPEGYVYNTYGKNKYLKHAIASVTTLRRYDDQRPVALFCSQKHAALIEDLEISDLFNHIFLLPDENQSITGFKHFVFKFMPFDKNLFLDSDIIWCRDPDSLWKSLSSFNFTITGNQISDIFFGAPKGISIVKDLLLRRRNRTLKRFGLTYLSRVQSGMIYASDSSITEEVCRLAQEMLRERHQTHFRSRKEEDGRTEETCEWSLAMAMATLKIQVYPWFFGYESPQLDFIEEYTKYDNEFKHVECLLYSDRVTYNLRGLKVKWLRKLLVNLISLIPGRGDYMIVTPYCLHFGWYHQKKLYNLFSENLWNDLTSDL